jgi:hypothetical protein
MIRLNYPKILSQVMIIYPWFVYAVHYLYAYNCQNIGVCVLQ